jgi:hypothetical protein
MAAFYTLELGGVSGTSGVTGTVDGLPVVKPSATVGHGGRIRCFRGSYTLTGTAVTTADTLNICIMPAGSIFQFGQITSGVTLGTSTVAIGIAGTTGKYRAAAVFTAVDTPTPYGVTSIMANQTPITGDERIIGTIATANLPTTGQSLVIQQFASNA